MHKLELGLFGIDISPLIVVHLRTIKLKCSKIPYFQSVDPLDVFTAARVGSSSTTTQRPITTTSTPTTTTPISVLTVTENKPEDQAELDEKAAAAAAWALSRRWFYVNRLGRFRGQVGRRIINM